MRNSVLKQANLLVYVGNVQLVLFIFFTCFESSFRIEDIYTRTITPKNLAGRRRMAAAKVRTRNLRDGSPERMRPGSRPLTSTFMEPFVKVSYSSACIKIKLFHLHTACRKLSNPGLVSKRARESVM